MVWKELHPIIIGENDPPLTRKRADIINRNIESLGELRAAVNTGTVAERFFPQREGKAGRHAFYTPEDATNECLRRELFIRIDIDKLLSTPETKQDVADIRKALTDRGGHRSGGGI